MNHHQQQQQQADYGSLGHYYESEAIQQLQVGVDTSTTAAAAATTTPAGSAGGSSSGGTEPVASKPMRLKKLTRYTDLWAQFTVDTVPPELQGTHFRCKWCVKALKEGGGSFTTAASNESADNGSSAATPTAAATDNNANNTATATTSKRGSEIRNIRKVTTRDACVHIYKCPHVPEAVKIDLLDLLAAHVKEVQMPRSSPFMGMGLLVGQAPTPQQQQQQQHRQLLFHSSSPVGKPATRGAITNTTPTNTTPTAAMTAARAHELAVQTGKERLKQECIAAVRKLAKQGILTAEQKRALLTDVITCSTRRITSNVQMAYELLVNGGGIGGDGAYMGAAAGAGYKEGMAEFAEQCQVFAADLLYHRSTTSSTMADNNVGGSYSTPTNTPARTTAPNQPTTYEFRETNTTGTGTAV